ncbi:MAG TPA: hypothetical protein VMW47_08615 [Verrucomicrobiae bacterium]|nr:hypothetical protein [Verrucomicrobiae bacterium]
MTPAITASTTLAQAATSEPVPGRARTVPDRLAVADGRTRGERPAVR